jgi:hypothetical protein
MASVIHAGRFNRFQVAGLGQIKLDLDSFDVYALNDRSNVDKVLGTGNRVTDPDHFQVPLFADFR